MKHIIAISSCEWTNHYHVLVCVFIYIYVVFICFVPQWFTLKRQHAMIIMADSLYYTKFKHYCKVIMISFGILVLVAYIVEMLRIFFFCLCLCILSILRLILSWKNKRETNYITYLYWITWSLLLLVKSALISYI